MKALLINPYVPYEVVYGEHSKEHGAVLPPLGIFYLASYQKAIGRKHIVEILDANAYKIEPNALINYVAKFAPNIIGFTATTLAYPYAVENATLIKNQFPDIVIIMGGAHAQGDADGILKNHGGLFDFVCYGEGEVAFDSLLNYLDGSADEASLLGWKYVKNNSIIVSPMAAIPENLDLFGHPSELISPDLLSLYHEKVFAYKKLPMFSIMTSRGCPFQCTFCSTPNKFRNLYQKKMRYHSVEWIITELKYLQDHLGVKEIIFVDDTFNVKKERVFQICDAMRKNGNQIIWTCNFEANIADFEMINKMKKAGCWGIMIGGESGSEAMLKFIKKGVTTEQLRLVGEWANRAGMITRISFILGMPGDTRETIRETINFIKSCNFHFPYFQLYVPLPGTEMYNILSDYGVIVKKDTKSMSASSVNYIPGGVTEEFLMGAFNSAFRECYFRWKMLKNHLRFIKSFEDIMRYWRGFKGLMGYTKSVNEKRNPCI